MLLLGDGGLDGQQAVEAAVFLFLGGRIRQTCRRGAGAGGVDEGEESLEADLLDEGEGVLKLLLRLPGKPTMTSEVKTISGIRERP